MTNLDSILKSRDMTLLKKVLLIKAIGEGNGTPLQYSCLENPMDRRAWLAAVHGVARSWTWLSYFTLTFHFHALEKEMATHSRVLAWRIPGTVEPGGLLSLGSHRVGHDWSDLAAAAAVKAMVFPVVMYGCESWTINKTEHQRMMLWTVVLEKTLVSPVDCKEIQPVHPKGNQPCIYIGSTDA